MGDIGQGIEQFVDAATQAFRQGVLAPCALQGLEQALQRALTVLLAGQLLAQFELVETPAEGQEIQRLAALHLSAEQAAEGQRQRRFQRQLAARQRAVEQAHYHLVERLL
ncbi:hypothetical protein D9M69_614700 [compost metagenome]